MVDLPEEQQRRGYFTDSLYGLSPMILDSANAEILAFAERFRARFEHDPVWMTVAGYDAGRLAVEAARAAAAGGARVQERGSLRGAVLSYLLSLDSPARALPGLLGPMWFDGAHGRQQAVRIGRCIGTGTAEKRQRCDAPWRRRREPVRTLVMA